MDPNKCFEENMSLVGYIFQKHFKSHSKYYEDLMQEGYIALWRSCCKFNEDLGYKFSTYACKSIQTAMMNYLKKEQSTLNKIIPLSTVIAEDGEGSEIYLLDTLPVFPEDKSLENLIEVCISNFSNKEQNIIKSLMIGNTQSLTAVICHTSQASVSRCLSKLRNMIEDELKR